MIAARAGGVTAVTSQSPVLRGMLLTGGQAQFLRRELSDVHGEGDAAAHALWWPPSKIAGRYLAPYLSTARPAMLGDEPLVDRVAGAPADPAAHEAALELALLVADEDAAAGDYTQALHALDAAATLSGGVLPADFAERRARWSRELAV